MKQIPVFDMQQSTKSKLYAMFWDLSPVAKQKAVEKIIIDPVKAFKDEQILLRALNGLSWYELVELTGGTSNLVQLLNDSVIARLFPETRRKFYRNARRLLRKYIVSVTG
jgi:predicted secreted protein